MNADDTSRWEGARRVVKVQSPRGYDLEMDSPQCPDPDLPEREFAASWLRAGVARHKQTHG